MPLTPFKSFSLAESMQAAQSMKMNRLRMQLLRSEQAKKSRMRDLAQMSRKPTYGEYDQPEEQFFAGEAPIAGLKQQTGTEYDPKTHAKNLQRGGFVDEAQQMQENISKMSKDDREESTYKANEFAQLVYQTKGNPDLWDKNSQIALKKGLITKDQVVPYSDEAWQQAMNDTLKIKDLLEADDPTAGDDDIKLKKMEDGYFHKFLRGTDLGVATNKAGEKVKFWESEKEKNIGDRASDRGQRSDEKFTESKAKDIRTQTTATRKEYNSDIAKLSEMDELIDSAMLGLEQGGGLGDKVVKIALSKLTNSKVRALAELQEYKTYGTAAQRAAGYISQFLHGEKTDEQKQQALDLLTSFRDKYVRPGISASKHYYRALAKKNKLDPHEVAKFDDQNDVKQALQAGLITEKQAVEIIKMIGFKK